MLSLVSIIVKLLVQSHISMNMKEQQLPYPLTSFPRHLLCVPDTDEVKQKKKNVLLLLNKPQKKKHTQKNAGYDKQGSIADQ